jgi:hypothetical protein
METTEQNNVRLRISLHAQKQNDLLGWLAEQVTILAEALGETMTAARLKVYATDLADLERSQLEIVFQRARRECRFFPKISELRELAGAGRMQGQAAEPRKAWDVLIQFVSRYVGNDVYGNYGPDHGWYPKSYSKLSDCILDTVRRTGGWRVYARMTEADFPFVQKRFFEEYEAWTAVQQVTQSKLLTEMPRLQLVAKPMDPPRCVQPKAEQAEVQAFKPKSIPSPLTDAQLRDRREMLRQQAASLQATEPCCRQQSGQHE